MPLYHPSYTLVYLYRLQCNIVCTFFFIFIFYIIVWTFCAVLYFPFCSSVQAQFKCTYDEQYATCYHKMYKTNVCGPAIIFTLYKIHNIVLVYLYLGTLLSQQHVHPSHISSSLWKFSLHVLLEYYSTE